MTAKKQPAPAPAKAAAGRLWAGTSGWAYPTWKPGFYPAKGLPARRFLEFYASRLNAVEVNYTFSSRVSAGQLADWLAQVKAAGRTRHNFRFVFKAPQTITHFKRLRMCKALVQEFVDSLEPVARAGMLGPLLFQLPPNFKADAPRLAEFLAEPVLQRRGLRTAWEFRHASWFAPETWRALRKGRALLCEAQTDDLQTPAVTTVPGLRYLRLRQTGGYSKEEVAGVLAQIDAGESYCIFRHEEKPTGPLAAMHLLALNDTN